MRLYTVLLTIWLITLLLVIVRNEFFPYLVSTKEHLFLPIGFCIFIIFTLLALISEIKILNKRITALEK